eukprot:GHUV01023569.1.p1 GENE.GHUV01023569.1~~GHUV01023569.1.p1  ORF type:complete len:1540 (+),score=641.95 GHUV01023569.1:53-4672(+)
MQVSSSMFCSTVLLTLISTLSHVPWALTSVAVHCRRPAAGAFEAVNQLDPHIYLVAGAAFRDMVRMGTSQSLVINGESGAGKTETTKKAMQFFASLAGGTASGVDKQVLETNPILEAFGNAKTQRNHNSSRFGKLIEIHFNKTNHICGARIRTYLLEKSRVVHQLKGERSFHIFYQLVRGTKDESTRKALRLPIKVTEFNYLNKSGCTDIDGVDDVQNFHEVLEALSDIGVSDRDIRTLLSTLSGILWLGNVRIDPVHADDSSRVETDAALSNAAAMLGLTENDLAHAITHKKIKTRDELIVKPLTQQEAIDARDALAKALYAGVFNWVVAAVNAKLDMGKKASGRFIAILDIYGFEQFQINSFEQLCINYANERLQQQFTRHLFTLEQEEYQAEGIDWTKVEWIDNQACVEVIEGKTSGLGVLSVLDGQCQLKGTGTDEAFINELRTAAANGSLVNKELCGFNPRRQDEFIIQHYAGPVPYSALGFLDKNKDMLNADIIELMSTSSSALITAIGCSTAEEMEGKRGGQTVSSRFTGQLKDLVSMLDTTGLHFVRCIKPNSALSPGSFTSDLVLQQLRCCGVLEVARVSRAGYPTRYRHADFVQRYQILLPREQQDMVLSNEVGTRSAVQQLLGVFKVPPGQYEMGKTKVFFKPGVLGYVEDTWAKMQAGALKLQAYTRMYMARNRYMAARSAAVLMQSGWKARQQRLAYAGVLREYKAAVAIQRHYRGYAARQEYQKVRRAITVFQAAERRRQLNKRVARLVEQRLAREAAEAAAEAARRQREEGFDALKAQYGFAELSEVKAALSCYSALKSELNSNDPADVQQALALLATVRTTTGSSELAQDQLKLALHITAVCQQQLGPTMDAEQLQETLATAAAVNQYPAGQVQQALAAAEICRDELGDAVAQSEQRLREALAAAKLVQQQLGTLSGPTVQDALSTAALAKQELGSEQQLREAIAAAKQVQQELGSLNSQLLQQSLTLGVVARQQLGAAVDQQKLREVLQLGDVCQQAGVQQTGQLQHQLKLAAAAAAATTPDEVASAVALQKAVQQAAGHVPQPDQVAAAIKLQQAAEDEGITDASSLTTALAAAAAAATAAAVAIAAEASQQTAQEPASEAAEEQRKLGAIALQQGVTEPSDLQVALSMYKHLRRDGHAFDPRHARRACSMYAAAQTHGIADKRDFMAAAALYGVLREDGITSATELRLAVAMYSAVREEDIADPEDLHSAIVLANVARFEGITDVEELRAALRASRGAGYNYYFTGGANGDVSSPAAHNMSRLGSLRNTGGVAVDSPSEVQLQQQVMMLQHQLENEKAARAKYAKQLEQQAVEWMGQVKLLKEYIDSLRAKMPPQSGGGLPPLQLPSHSKISSGGGSESKAAHILRQLDSDWSAKSPLFEDDAAFIQEVVDGEVLAPDMQVQVELDRLRQKYEAWNKQFKERMREVQAQLRRTGSTISVTAASGGLVSSPSIPANRPASITSSIDSAAAIDLRKMPDLTAPNLIDGQGVHEWMDGQHSSDGGASVGKKSKLKSVFKLGRR